MVVDFLQVITGKLVFFPKNQLPDQTLIHFPTENSHSFNCYMSLLIPWPSPPHEIWHRGGVMEKGTDLLAAQGFFWRAHGAMPDGSSLAQGING